MIVVSFPIWIRIDNPKRSFISGAGSRILNERRKRTRIKSSTAARSREYEIGDSSLTVSTYE